MKVRNCKKNLLKMNKKYMNLKLCIFFDGLKM